MPHRIRCLLAAMAVVASLGSEARDLRGSSARGAPVQTSAAATGTGLLVGVIVDSQTGRPVAGSLVTLSDRNRLVRTDAQGRFVFAELPKGTYTISATKAGYSDGALGRRRANGPAQVLPLADGERIGDLKIPIWMNASISGTISDEVGEPMVDLAVRVMRTTFVAGRRLLTLGSTVKTDDRGVYRIDALTPGDYVLVVPSTQTTVPQSVVDLYPGAQPAGGISDVRRDFSASGASNALDLIVRAGGFSVAGFRFQSSSSTPRSGVVPQPSQNGRIFVYPTQYYPAALTAAQAVAITVRSGEERAGVDVQLKLVPTSRVSGTVRGPDGPLTVGLSLTPDSDEVTTNTSLETATTVSDAEGRFTFLGVPQGTYLLRAAKAPPGPTRGAPPPTVPTGPTLWATQRISVDASNVVDVAVALRNGFHVAGRLEFDDAANPPAPDQVRRIMPMVESADGRPLPSLAIARGVNDSTGQFSTYQLPSGRYYLRATGLPSGWTLKRATVGGQDISDVPLTLDRDVTGVVVTLTNHPSALTGRVQDAAGLPDAKATVLIFPTESALWVDYGDAPRRLRSIRADKDGGYRVVGPPAGDYLVVAIPDEAAADWQDPRVLQALARVATPVKLADGEIRSLELKTMAVSR